MGKLGRRYDHAGSPGLRFDHTGARVDACIDGLCKGSFFEDYSIA